MPSEIKTNEEWARVLGRALLEDVAVFIDNNKVSGPAQLWQRLCCRSRTEDPMVYPSSVQGQHTQMLWWLIEASLRQRPQLYNAFALALANAVRFRDGYTMLEHLQSQPGLAELGLVLGENDAASARFLDLEKVVRADAEAALTDWVHAGSCRRSRWSRLATLRLAEWLLDCGVRHDKDLFLGLFWVKTISVGSGRAGGADANASDAAVLSIQREILDTVSAFNPYQEHHHVE